jgi:hypothetical protein
MAPLDLLPTKENTGRDQDQRDIWHLEDVIRRDYGARSPRAQRMRRKPSLPDTRTTWSPSAPSRIPTLRSSS